MKSYFIPARSQNAAWNVVKTLLQSALFWSLFLWLLPVTIHNLEIAAEISALQFQPQLTLGWILFTLCGTFGLTSGITLAVQGAGTPLPLNTAQKLVVRGPFRIVRNPMAVAGIGQGIAVGVVLGSAGVVIYSLVGALIWHLWVRPHEEADLLERFGDSYRRYQEATRLWIPKLPPRN